MDEIEMAHLQLLLHGTLALKPNLINLMNRLGQKTTPAAAAPPYASPRVKLLCGIDQLNG